MMGWKAAQRHASGGPRLPLVRFVKEPGGAVILCVGGIAPTILRLTGRRGLLDFVAERIDAEYLEASQLWPDWAPSDLRGCHELALVAVRALRPVDLLRVHSGAVANRTARSTYYLWQEVQTTMRQRPALVELTNAEAMRALASPWFQRWQPAATAVARDIRIRE